MTHAASHYLQLLRDAFPVEFLKALLQSVFVAHKAASDHTKRHFDREERTNMIGYTRRSKLNEELRALGQRFSIKVSTRPYGRGSGFYVLVSSKRIFMIVNVVPSRNAMVRDAHYRRQLAEFNRTSQESFAFIPPPAEKDDEQYLCILIHRRHRRKPYPAFADIAFPDNRFQRWMCSVNLFQEFPNLVNEWVQEREREIEPKEIKIRRAKRASPGQAASA